jgi:hypothetical protein
VQKRILPIAITAITFFSLFGWNCTKLDTTDIGSDLLPSVDNVNTFDTILNIISTQGFFNDSTYIGKYDDHALGSISNDPLFGTTSASIFMQLKPPFYPYYFGNIKDTLVGYDSVVLCLKYKGFWGDSASLVNLRVFEVNDTQFGTDSVYKENTTAYQPNIGNFLASADIDVRTLGNYVKFNNGRDSVIYQIRIRLPNSWGQALYNRDSTKNGSANNAFYNDSIYRRFYNGLAVLGGAGGNGLIYIGLADTATKIEMHYRRKNGGKIDSVYSSLRLNASLDPNAFNAPVSNTSNYIRRNRAGYPVSNPGANEHYIQTAPGTYVNLKIPGLAGLSNRIIHRAEIIIEQIAPADPLADRLTVPNFLYLDLKDSGSVDKWKPVYYDLNTTTLYDPDYKTTIPYWPGEIDYQYFGGYRSTKTGPFGDQIKYYNFNISRYVQHVVTNRMPVYDMRVYAPFNIHYNQYSTVFIPFSNNIAYGRVRIGSGSNPDYRLRLRIVYSKIK